MTLMTSTGIAGIPRTIPGTVSAALIIGAPTDGTAACTTAIIHLSGTILSGMIRSGDLHGASAGTIPSGDPTGVSVSVLSGVTPGTMDTDMLDGMIRGSTAIRIIMAEAAELTSVPAIMDVRWLPAVITPTFPPIPAQA